MNTKLNELKVAVLADGIVDADEVRAINNILYEDGKIEREEANFMFDLNDVVSGRENHYSWKDLFIKAITDHVLKDEQSYGAVDEDEADYLIGRIKSDGKIDETEQALLLKIVEKSTGACEKFQAFILESFKKIILEDSVIDFGEVNKIKTIIYGAGGHSGAKIDKQEADWLFELNDAVSGNTNHDSWEVLMVEAITKFLLEDENSPNEVDDNEADWLIGKIMKDGKMDSVESAILKSIKSKATKLSSKLQDL
jgi:hypothetical protein